MGELLDDGPLDTSPTASLSEPICVPALASCSTSHRVFVNLGDGVFEYDEARSDSLQALLAPPALSLHDNGIVEHRFTDVNGDGRADLALGHVANSASSDAPDASERQYRVFMGRSSGWGGVSNLIILGHLGLGGAQTFAGPTTDFAADWMADQESTRVVDLDGDGLADLVAEGQVRWNLGMPSSTDCEDGACDGPFEGSPWQSLQLLTADGVELGTSDELGSPAAPGCMHAGSSPRYLDSRIGTSSESMYRITGVGDPSDRVSPADWLQRHIRYTDITGDGIADRLVLLRWPAEDTATKCTDDGCSDHPTWVEDDSCGGVATLHIGTGDGTFIEADAGLGLPTTVSQIYGLDASDGVTWTYSTPVPDLALIDVDGDGRRELTRHCGYGLSVVADDLGAAQGGFGLDSSDACDFGRQGLIGGAGSTGADGTLVTLADLDGDGFADRVHGFNALGGGSSPGMFFSHEHARWARNERVDAPGLLVGVTDATGHYTSVSWRRARQGAEGWSVAANPRVVDTVTTEAGTTTFSFTEPFARAAKNTKHDPESITAPILPVNEAPGTA